MSSHPAYLRKDIGDLLGYYRFGETPVILDHGPDSALTVIHENTHYDDILNTYYGYVLARLTNLAQAYEQSGVGKRARALISELVSHSWNVFEGHAVINEIAFLVSQDERDNAIKLQMKMPEAYQKAGIQYDLITSPAVANFESMGIGPAFSNTLLFACCSALSEICLDCGFIQIGKPGVKWSKVLKTLKKNPPDAFMEENSEEISAFFKEFCLRMANSNLAHDPQAGTQNFLIEHFRKIVSDMKREYWVSCGRRKRRAVSVLMDSRPQILQSLEDQTYKAYPKLRHTQFKDVTEIGGRHISDTRTIEYAATLPTETIDADEMQKAIVQALPNPDIFSSVLSTTFVLDGKCFAGFYELEVKAPDDPVLQLRSPLRYCVDFPMRAVEELNEFLVTQVGRKKNGNRLIFLSSFVVADDHGIPNDYEELKFIQMPKYYFIPFFTKEQIEKFSRLFGVRYELSAAFIPYNDSFFTCLIAKCDEHTLIWLQSGVTRKTVAIGEVFEHLGYEFETINIGADADLASAVVAISGSYSHIIMMFLLNSGEAGSATSYKTMLGTERVGRDEVSLLRKAAMSQASKHAHPSGGLNRHRADPTVAISHANRTEQSFAALDELFSIENFTQDNRRLRTLMNKLTPPNRTKN